MMLKTIKGAAAQIECVRRYAEAERVSVLIEYMGTAFVKCWEADCWERNKWWLDRKIFI